MFHINAFAPTFSLIQHVVFSMDKGNLLCDPVKLYACKIEFLGTLHPAVEVKDFRLKMISTRL